MTKFQKWVAKHLTFCGIFSIIVALAVLFPLKVARVHTIIALVAYFAVILILVGVMNVIVLRPFVKLSALLNDSGDPSGLIEVCEFLQSCRIA